jgi:CBS domain-containing membrane protein
MSVAQGVVADVMQTEVVSLGVGDRLDLVEDIMRLGRVRHLPVLEDGRLVGLVSNRDLLAASLSKALDFEPVQRRSFVRSVQVDEVMTRELLTVEPSTPLREAAALLLERKIGCLPVVKPDGTLVGLLSDSDLVRAAFLADADAAVEASGSGEPAAPARGIAAEFESLRRARDELRVQAHLGAAEARDLWDALEAKFREAEARVKLVLREAEHPAEDVGEAARELFGEIREGYRRLRKER